jgi:hypothetical protein
MLPVSVFSDPVPGVLLEPGTLRERITGPAKISVHFIDEILPFSSWLTTQFEL